MHQPPGGLARFTHPTKAALGCWPSGVARKHPRHRPQQDRPRWGYDHAYTVTEGLSGLVNFWSILSRRVVIEQLSVGAIAKLLKHFHINAVAQRVGSAVADRKLQTWEWSEANPPTTTRFSRLDWVSSGRSSPFRRRTGVAQGGPRARHPSQVQRVGEFLADVNGVGNAVGHVVPADVAIEKQHAVIIDVDRRLDVILAARIVAHRQPIGTRGSADGHVNTRL